MRLALLVIGLMLLCGPVWAACGADSAPAAIQNYGITCETFKADPFSTTTIDVNDTATISSPAGSCSSGSCQWYTNPNFSNTVIGAQCPGAGSGTCPSTTSAQYSISSGSITLNRTSAYTAGRVDLLTCKASGTAPGYFGNVFSAPLYIEFTATTITTGEDSATAEAAVWALPVSYLTLGTSAAITANELDFVEGGVGVTKNINDVTSNGSGGQSEWFQSITPVIAGHANGTLILPQARNPNNDGYATGYATSYDNGSLVASNAVTWSAITTPKFNGGNFASPTDSNVGGLSTMNTDKWCIFLGSGFNKSLTLSSLRIWQLPPGTGGSRGMWSQASIVGEHGR